MVAPSGVANAGLLLIRFHCRGRFVAAVKHGSLIQAMFRLDGGHGVSHAMVAPSGVPAEMSP